MHTNKDGEPDESQEARMRRARQASEVAALGEVMAGWEDEALNGDARAKAEKQRNIQRFQRKQVRMHYRRVPTGITGVGYHKRAKVARSATAGKW